MDDARPMTPHLTACLREAVDGGKDEAGEAITPCLPGYRQEPASTFDGG